MRIMFSIIFYYIYFLSSASLKTHVLARRHTTNKNRLSFGPRKITSTIFVSLNSSSSSSVSSLPTSSDFFPEKDPRILETSVITISLIRGGQQGNGDYYDSKGYQNDSPSSSSSSSSQQQQDSVEPTVAAAPPLSLASSVHMALSWLSESNNNNNNVASKGHNDDNDNDDDIDDDDDYDWGMDDYDNYSSSSPSNNDSTFPHHHLVIL
mmetsp:Transcript_17342/g.17431  ORF Transcript_17342/g.17431 Transcript_17342/m.17431 type:complete len:208 (+) Transcript_17342:69-692(+)